MSADILDAPESDEWLRIGSSGIQVVDNPGPRELDVITSDPITVGEAWQSDSANYDGDFVNGLPFQGTAGVVI